MATVRVNETERHSGVVVTLSVRDWLHVSHAEKHCIPEGVSGEKSGVVRF